MKIGYFADGPWSHNAFKLIIQDPQFQIKFVVPRKNTNDSTLKELCSNYSIDYLPNQSVNSETFLNLIIDYRCDIFVSMSFDQIFKKEILNLTKLGIINCHAGMLPFYRGRNILNWVLINDEKEFGITVHHVDEGIDTGDIILQKAFPISELDNYSSLLKKAFIECATILHDALISINEGSYKRLPQIEIDQFGSYCGRRIDGDEKILWTKSSREIHNLIRAVSKPGPEAYILYDNNKYRIPFSNYFENIKKYIGTPGQVLYKKNGCLGVKTGDSFIEIFIDKTNKIKVGDRLN